MTEFQLATIAFQEDTIRFQELSLIVSSVIGLIQCGLIYYGLRRIEQTGKRRDKQVDQQGEALAEIGAGIREVVQQSQQQREALAEVGKGI